MFQGTLKKRRSRMGYDSWWLTFYPSGDRIAIYRIFSQYAWQIVLPVKF